MRLVRILNISVVVLFLALWVILIVKRESYQGDGLLHPSAVRSDSTHFSHEQPYGILYDGSIMGFTSSAGSNGRVYASGLWQTDTRGQKVAYFPFPASHRFDSLITVQATPDSTLFIVGLSRDSIVKLIYFDSIVKPGMTFRAPSDIKAVHFMKDKPEIVFGRQKKLVGSIAAVGDTSVTFRKYELPGFFDRICEIVTAYPQKNKWRFLLMTSFHRKNEKWIELETKNKTNFLVFDERAVYPDYPGMLNITKKRTLRLIDKSMSGLIPDIHEDSVLLFNKDKFTQKAVSATKNNFTIWFNLIGDSVSTQISDWDNLSSDGGKLSHSAYLQQDGISLPFVEEAGRFIFVMPEKESRQQIFLTEKEMPVGLLQLRKDSVLFISNRLNVAFLNDDGRLLDRKNIFALVNNTVLRLQPGTVHVLDTDFPTFRAVLWFIVLYGLILLWLLSLVVIWLIEAIRPRPKFAVRDRKWPFLLRLMPGSALYLLLYLINIYSFLQAFSIHFF